MSEEVLQRARDLIDDGMSKRKAAEILDVNESTLRKRLKKGFGVSSLGAYRPTFNTREEEELAEYCRNLDLRFFGLTMKTLRQLAYQYAVINNINHRFNDETEMAGVDWARCFMSRHNLSLRTPQKTSVGRIMGFNKPQVTLFFDNLTNLMSIHKFPPSRVFNMDESGIPTVPNKVPKVISPKGKKLVGKVVSADRGQTVTVVCCMSAAGNYVPPAIIFPRKRDRPELMHGAPPASVMFLSDSGYINGHLFVDWLRHFQKHVQATQTNPVLLILDNHSSHISLEAVIFARNNFIHLLSIPPHSSHKVQPLDKCFFKPLKDFYAANCDQWVVNNPGKVISQFQVAELFGLAYLRCATVQKAVNGFKTFGIVPVNRFVFSEEDYLPSDVTDQPMERNVNVTENQKSAQNAEKNGSDFQDPKNAAPLICSSDSGLNPQPSTSGTVHTSPSDMELLPMPKIASFRTRMKKGKKSTIPISTPNKNELEEERSRKVAIEKRRISSKKLNFGNGKNNRKHVNQEFFRETEVLCPGCNELYEDPPIEDWVQCCKCREWWHENCSSYEGGKLFICDLC